MANAELPHTVVGLDICGFSTHTTPGQGRLVDDLNALFGEACATVGVSGLLRDSGDGGFWLFSADVPRSRLVARLPRELSIGLNGRNRVARPEYHLRVRMAIHHGVVWHHGTTVISHAINQTRRIVDGKVGRQLLNAAPDADLVLLLSDDMFAGTVADELSGGLMPADFTPVRLGPGEKGAGTLAWACLWANGSHTAPGVVSVAAQPGVSRGAEEVDGPSEDGDATDDGPAGGGPAGGRPTGHGPAGGGAAGGIHADNNHGVLAIGQNSTAIGTNSGNVNISGR
ncbi:hypothetical protein [Pseudofrankia inefficax]|uniref:Guanylate cyclase domain-containing protein n=1 Tax=Pseudofrankia inefficax (strain DSM 45817 / CECT 9037 / DDB 130130 / EuI1c) TaxID=298654 RepID=E3IZ34_PSEI1|nr:hypothetical protein [Pseudofrankia inefficax]ADP80317.1 hypothetical protein FraEuI1c_2278 [Pseudofrankia inefficax]